jgi:hypothetical protein
MEDIFIAIIGMSSNIYNNASRIKHWSRASLIHTLLQPSPKSLVPLEMIPQNRLKHERFIGAFRLFLCGLHIEIKLFRNLFPEPESSGNRLALHLNIEIDHIPNGI